MRAFTIFNEDFRRPCDFCDNAPAESEDDICAECATWIHGRSGRPKLRAA